jgi:hypothetical protein
MTTKLMIKLTNPSVLHMSSNFKWLEIKEHTLGTNVAATLQPCKTLFFKTPKLWKIYKGIRKKKMENLAQTRSS